MSLVRKKGKVVPPNEYISSKQFKDVRRPGRVDTIQAGRHGAHAAAGRLLLLRQGHHPAGHRGGAEALRQPEQEPAALPLALAQVDLLQLLVDDVQLPSLSLSLLLTVVYGLGRW